MRDKLIRICILILIILLIAVQYTGCISNSTGDGASDSAGLLTQAAASDKDAMRSNVLQQVELSMYLIGDPPAGFELMNTELNNRLTKDICATVKFDFLSWGDYDKKYPLILSSGEGFDLIFSAGWIAYDTQAQKGGFLALDELLPEYAPNLFSVLPANAIEQCKVGGKLYMIPSMDVGVNALGFFVRGDIMKKYGIPPIKTIEDFGVYLETVKENMPGLIPMNLAGTRADVAALNCLWLPKDDTWTGGFGLGLNILGSQKNPADIFSVYFTPEYENFIRTMNVWAEKGYWSKSMLSNKVSAGDAFKNGTSAACITNIVDANAKYLEIIKDHPDWEPEYFPAYPDIPCYRDIYKGNGVSIGVNSKNPERAMMLMELMNTKESYHDLVFYGIKGTNYTLTQDNKRQTVPGKPVYSGEDTSIWGFANAKFTKFPVNTMPEFERITADDAARAIDSPYVNFVLNTDNIKTEIAALNSVRDQYATPLTAGMIPVDEGLKTLRDKLASAGLDKVVSEIKKQVAVYLSSRY